MPTSSKTVASSSQDSLYFTLTAIVSVIAGLVVIAIILGILVKLVVHNKKERQTLQPAVMELSQAPLPNVYSCYDKEPKSGYSSSNSISTSSSGDLRLNSDLLKHLGTQV